MSAWKRLGVAAGVLVFVGGGVVVANASTSSHPNVRYSACLSAKTQTLTKVTINEKLRCANGFRLITWNAQGPTGSQGPAGVQGSAGIPGPTGSQGPAGVQGSTGSSGAAGPQGSPGPMGPAGSNLGYAEFFALMPGDNSATVAVGDAVEFPQVASEDSSGHIMALTPSSFLLTDIGTYEISFQVSIDEPGQLELNLNGSALNYTVVGRATGTTQLVGESLVTTTTANSVLEVVNPPGNSTALTVTPIAGGANPVSASLVIVRLH